jgi:hypothetical protein
MEGKSAFTLLSWSRRMISFVGARACGAYRQVRRVD